VKAFSSTPTTQQYFMAQVVEDYDPKYEFLAPKYVNLLEAASEEALYDGADEWFDELQRKTELAQDSSQKISHSFLEEEESPFFDGKSNGETPAENFARVQIDSDSTVHMAEKENNKSELNTKESFKENNKHYVGQELQQNEKTLTENTKTIEQHLDQVVGPQEQERLSKQRTSLEDVQQSPEPIQPVVLKEQLESNYANQIHQPDEILDDHYCHKNVTHINADKDADSNQHIEQPKHNLFHAREKKTCGPPALRTEQRACLHKERRKSSTDINQKMNEPRTPKNYGESWKPSITIPHSPKFHSERRLRHCVERSLQQRPNEKTKPVKVVRGGGSLTLTVPESPTFYTQKRAEAYRALKGVPLTYEEEEMHKIQAEREALRKTIQSGRQVCAKAIHFNDSRPSKERNNREATIPRKFNFATEERSLQRSNSMLKGSDSNNVQQGSSNSKSDSTHSLQVARERTTPSNTSRSTGAKRTNTLLRSFSKTGSIDIKRTGDSSRTANSEASREPSRNKNFSVGQQKTDVFTRLYQSGKRRLLEALPNTNKSVAADKSKTQRPVILNSRVLPKPRTVSNGNNTEKNKADREEHGKLRPQYAFRNNSPIHNKARRASRVPIVENEKDIGKLNC